MLKFLERSPLRVLTVILFMVVALPSQKALGAEMTTEQAKADAYLWEVINGQETFNEEKVRKAVGIISAHFIQNDPQATVPNILSGVLDNYTRGSLKDASRHNFLKTYRKQGKGFLHLLRDSGSIYSFLNNIEVDDEKNKLLSDMLKAEDGQGRTPLDGVFVDNSVFESLKRIDPNLLVTTTGPDNITPLMALALNDQNGRDDYREERYEECKSSLLDLRINTADADYLAKLNSKEIDRMVGAKLTLNDQIWEDIPKNIYSKLRWQEFTHYQFSAHALSIAAGTDAESPLFQSFWQQNTKERQGANRLWEAYFAEKDRFEERGWDYNDPQEVLGRKRPLRLRVIDEFSRAYDLDPGIKQTALKNMISTGGTFGINFKRTARDLSFEEIEAMKVAIESYVDAAYAAKDQEFGGAIYTDLRKSISWVFDEEEKKKKILAFIKSNLGYTVRSTKNAEELLKEYVEPEENRIRPNIVEKVTAQIRDDLMPSAEKLAGFNQGNNRRLANHQMTCAVLAAEHLLRLTPFECAERINSNIDWFLEQSAIGLGQKGLQITVDREGRFQRFYDLYHEKCPDYEQRVDALRASQAATREDGDLNEHH